MSLYSFIKRLIGQAPKEQIIGYSISELKSVFTEPLLPAQPPLPHQLRAISLEDAGVPAYYASLLIDGDDIRKFLAYVESSLNFADERKFNDLPVKRYESAQKNQNFIFCASSREFNSITIQMVTDSIDALDAIGRERFAVPPPWIAFEGYNPSWWGGNMQGAQGYYNDNYFFPFFKKLSSGERRAYYARYDAVDEWVNSLELMCDD
ncbi:hypothetical protein [Pseudomonas viridiflava]|uniref:hypothetical protein n=1 Tax=Pseudomonas viridiflava TaxID=33069 RepID=UPI000F03E596|nr:hypothetical protein [Pseudomonas viridiflava]